MANVYIKTAEGGETTSPAGTEGIPLDDGANSTWISINNIAEYIRTLTQTLTNKTLTAPTIADFTNATHNHSNAAGGGALLLNKNILINGGFDFFQRITPSTATAMTDDVYNAPDRWYSLVQGTNATVNRNAGIGTSQYSCKLVAGGTTNRYGIAQIIEASNSIPLRGQTVIAQCRVKPVNNAGSGTRDYRIAILEWTGTANTVTSEVVNDWTSSTYTTGNFFASTTLTLVATANVTATHNAESVLSVSGAVSSSCNNLIVFIWAEDVPTHASDYVLIGEAGLYVSSTTQTWSPIPVAQELALCQRYYSKSYEIDTAPGTATATGMAATYNDATTQTVGYVGFKVNMRIAATPVLYSSVTGTASRIRSSGADVAYTSITSGSSGISVVAATLTAAVTSTWQYVVDAEL